MNSIKRTFNKFAQKFTNIIDAWNNKTPYQQLRFYISMFSSIGRTCLQLHCIFEDKPIGPIGYAIGICCVIHTSLLVYTTYFYITMGQFIKCIPSYCVFGMVVSTYSMYWCSVLTGEIWRMLIYQPAKFLHRNDRQQTAYNRICWDGLTDSAKQLFIITSVVLLTFVGAASGPIYRYMHGGILVTLYELRIPLLINDPNTEFLINFIWQGLINCIGVLGFALIESGMALINNTISVSSKLNRLSLQELSKLLDSKNITRREAHQRLKLIFMQIIYWNGYLDNFKKLMYWRLFLAPPTLSFSIAISIYSQSVLDYPAGYGLAMVSYTQLGILCYTGQNAVDRTSRLITAFEEFKWYLLSKDSQRDVINMLSLLQNLEGPKIGPFQPLSYMTFKNLTRSVYTFLMFLTNFDV